MNIVWTVESYEIDGNAQNISSYEPFHLVYGDSLFFGDDGCNTYGGLYEVHEDSVFPGDWWMTLLFCDVVSFPVEHLTEAYRYDIQIDRRELIISAGDSVYIYRSNFLNEIDSLFPHKEWVLKSSSDFEFEQILGEGVRIVLRLDENRGFEAEWVCARDPDNYGCGEIQGLFGIGDKRSIRFYRTGARGTGTEWSRYLTRILKSSYYEASDSTLTLSDSALFEFSP